MEKIIKCVDCGIDFEFTEGEQKFYEKMEFGEPIRCKSCRLAKKRKFGNKGGINDRFSFQSRNRSKGD